MKKFAHSLALIVSLSASPLQAARDTGLILNDTAIGHRASGLGVSATVRIKLGSDQVVKKSERVKLGLSAGPAFVKPDSSARNGVIRGNSSLVGFELKPGYSTSLNLAGAPVMKSYTLLGAAESDEADDSKGKQSTIDKVAWVAAVAGGVMVVLVGGVLIYLTNCDDCSE